LSSIGASVATPGLVGGFAHFLHRRQQQTDQNSDDRDHDQQLNQGESLPLGCIGFPVGWGKDASHVR
jgi:hypothetical protein